MFGENAHSRVGNSWSLRVLCCAMLIVVLAISGRASSADAMKSYLPGNAKLMRYVIDYFDIRSASMGVVVARSPPAPDRLLSVHGMRLVSLTTDHAELDWSGSETIGIDILGRGDYNLDGVEDVYLCVTENFAPGGGTGISIEPLTITKYSKDAPLVGIAFRHSDDRCKAVEH